MAWRKSGEWTWTWRRRSRAAKKLDEQKKKLQKELREIENSCVCRGRFRNASRVTCCSNCKKWSKGGMTSCQSTRKCRKYHKRCKAFKIKEEKKRKEGTAAQEEMRKIRWEIDRNEERLRHLSDKVDKYRMVDAEMAAELQGLQAGEERRGSNASQTGGLLHGDEGGIRLRYGSRPGEV